MLISSCFICSYLFLIVLIYTQSPIEDPRVGGSIPPRATKLNKGLPDLNPASLYCLCNCDKELCYFLVIPIF